MEMLPGTRRRVLLAGTAVPVIGLGLAINFAMDGAAAGFAGDALYAAMMYLAVAFVGVRARLKVVALIAFGVCAAIEVVQLTGGPAALAEQFPLSRLVFGTGFDPIDLIAYAVGTTVTLVCDFGMRRPQTMAS